MAYFKSFSGKITSGQNEAPYTLLGGYNLPSANIKTRQSQNEAFYTLNMTIEKGVLSSRRSQCSISNFSGTTPNGAAAYNNINPHFVDVTTWYSGYGGSPTVIAAGLANAQAKLLEFNTQTHRYMVLMNGTDRKLWDGTVTTDITDANCPLTNIICTDDNKIYALKDSTISWCADWTPTDWTTLGLAGSKPIAGMVGPGTCIVTYNDKVISFSDNTMHILYGSDIDNFELSDPMQHGCVGPKAAAVCNDVLYFIENGSIKAFNGASVINVGTKVQGVIDKINSNARNQCAVSNHGKYVYFSIPLNSATKPSHTLVYDTTTNTWQCWDTGYCDFIKITDSGLAGFQTNENILRSLEGAFIDDTPVIRLSSEYQSGIIRNGLNKLALSDVTLEYAISSDAYLHIDIYEIDDNGVETLTNDIIYIVGIGGDSLSKIRTKTAVINGTMSSGFRFRIRGTSAIDIHAIGFNYRII